GGFPESSDQGTENPERENREHRHVQSAHAQHVSEPAEGELVFQFIPKLGPKSGGHGEVQGGGFGGRRERVGSRWGPLSGVRAPARPPGWAGEEDHGGRGGRGGTEPAAAQAGRRKHRQR